MGLCAVTLTATKRRKRSLAGEAGGLEIASVGTGKPYGGCLGDSVAVAAGDILEMLPASSVSGLVLKNRVVDVPGSTVLVPVSFDVPGQDAKVEQFCNNRLPQRHDRTTAGLGRVDKTHCKKEPVPGTDMLVICGLGLVFSRQPAA
jgi:hypothetical protein